MTGQVALPIGSTGSGLKQLTASPALSVGQALDAVAVTLRTQLGVPAVAITAYDGERYTVVALDQDAGATGELRPGLSVDPEQSPGLVVLLEDEEGAPVGSLYAPGIGAGQLADSARDTVALLGRLVVRELDSERRRREEARSTELKQRVAELGDLVLAGQPLPQILAEGAGLYAELVGARRHELLQIVPDGPPRPWPGVDTGPVAEVAAELVEATLAGTGRLITPNQDDPDAVTVALRIGDAPVAVLGGFGCQSRLRPGNLALADSVANVLGYAIRTDRLNSARAGQGRLEARLTEISTQFIDLADDQIDAGIVSALGAVGAAIGATSATVHRTVGDEGLRRTHTWPSSGSASDPSSGFTDGSQQPWTAVTGLSQEALRHGDPVLVGGREGADAVLVLPFRADGEVLGCVAFAAPEAPAGWGGEVGRSLRPISDIVTHAVARQRASAEWRESERRYRNLVDAISDVIVHIDAIGRVSYVNQAWIDFTGLTLENMVGRDAFDSVLPEDRIMAGEHVARALQGAKGEVAEIRFMSRKGGVRWMEVKGQLLLDADGQYAGLTGVLHDVTVRREAEAEVRASAEAAELARQQAEQAAQEAELARDEAVQASSAKSEFLSRMSHELRTPLDAILGFGQLLQLSELEGDDADNVGQIVKAGRHLLDLINEVLDVVRVESGRLDLALEPVQVTDVVEESLDLVRASAQARGIRIHSPGRAGQAFALADRQRLKQILANLLSNAVTYNRDGGELVVGCDPLPAGEWPIGLTDSGNGWLRLSISDTGTGIAAEHLEQVFVPFERLGAEGTSVEGTGVGLALTRTLVEALGGRIELRSELNHGTVVLVDLPAAQAYRDRDTVSGPAGEATHTVLYVEDNESNVMLIRRLLTRRPHVRLVVVRDGAEAVEAAARVLPDLVLLDLQLPGLPGTGVLSALRGSEQLKVREVPVVVITSDAGPGTERRVIEAGANRFLPKPIDIPDLLGIIDQHLPRPS